MNANGEQHTSELDERARSIEDPGVSLHPATAFEAVTRQMVEGLSEDVKEIRERINGMFWLIAGSVLLEAITRMAGLGR